MSSTTVDKQLEETVATLEQKAERIEQSKDTESKVEEARSQIARICNKLDTIAEKGEELRFYVELYEGAFGSGEKRPSGIQPHVQEAVHRIGIPDEELLEGARNQRLQDLEDQVRKGEEQVDEAIEVVTDALGDAQAEWNDDLDSAEELNKIIGGNDEFQDLIGQMRQFLNTDMWNTSREPSQLTALWQRYERNWQENEGKHGWDTFQSEHGLTDNTIAELKQFTDDDPVRLSDLSLSTLEDVKRVPDLESALQLEVRS